jgi:hypothetical protein
LAIINKNLSNFHENLHKIGILSPGITTSIQKQGQDPGIDTTTNTNYTTTVDYADVPHPNFQNPIKQIMIRHNKFSTVESNFLLEYGLDNIVRLGFGVHGVPDFGWAHGFVKDNLLVPYYSNC